MKSWSAPSGAAGGFASLRDAIRWGDAVPVAIGARTDGALDGTPPGVFSDEKKQAGQEAGAADRAVRAG